MLLGRSHHRMYQTKWLHATTENHIPRADAKLNNYITYIEFEQCIVSLHLNLPTIA